MSMTQAEEAWTRSPERTKASDTLFSYLSGHDIRADHKDHHPTTIAELRSCRLMLEDLPHLRPKLNRMAHVNKYWLELVNFWDDLCFIHEIDDDNWRAECGKAKNAQHMLNNLIGLINENLAR